jgi:hypothetical protein
MSDRQPQNDRGRMNSTFTFALAAERRADLLRLATHDQRRQTALAGAPALGQVRVPRRRPRWWQRAKVASVQTPSTAARAA